MKPRFSAALVIVLAACGGSGTEVSETAPTVPSTTTSVSATSATPTTMTTTTTAPATDGGAAAWFDPQYLSLGPGSGFVSLDDPVMVPAADVDWMRRDSLVLGVLGPGGEAHAFPVDMMAYHHIANTSIAGEPYLVTY